MANPNYMVNKKFEVNNTKGWSNDVTDPDFLSGLYHNIDAKWGV